MMTVPERKDSAALCLKQCFWLSEDRKLETYNKMLGRKFKSPFVALLEGRPFYPSLLCLLILRK